MNKTNSIILLVLIAGIIGFVFWKNKDASPAAQTYMPEPVPTTNEPASSTTPGTTEATVKLYALTEVAVHSNAVSCWSAINGGVYDLTTWIKQHPGGQQAILSICGKDGSAAFNGQHGGMQKQADILATFKIGDLK